jgi:hypothetical protein
MAEFPMRGFGLVRSTAGLCGILLSMALAPALYAHKAPSGFEYPASCCSGDKSIGDCQMISAKVVRETRHGYAVVLLPGDHRLVTRRQSFRIPYGQQINSPDGNYHICLYPSETVVFCFFAPQGST